MRPFIYFALTYLTTPHIHVCSWIPQRGQQRRGRQERDDEAVPGELGAGERLLLHPRPAARHQVRRGYTKINAEDDAVVAMSVILLLYVYCGLFTVLLYTV